MSRRFSVSAFLVAVVGMGGFALVGHGFVPASASQPPGSRPAAFYAATQCPAVGTLQNIGYVLAKAGQPRNPTRLGLSGGTVLWVHGAVPVGWVGGRVGYCPAGRGRSAQVCIKGRCTEAAPAPEGWADAGPVNRKAASM